jgi:hypothetical protein
LMNTRRKKWWMDGVKSVVFQTGVSSVPLDNLFYIIPFPDLHFPFCSILLLPHSLV